MQLNHEQASAPQSICIEPEDKQKEETKGGIQKEASKRRHPKGRPFEQNSSALRIEPTMKRGDEAAPRGADFVGNPQKPAKRAEGEYLSEQGSYAYSRR
jgi:hypothetical protein